MDLYNKLIKLLFFSFAPFWVFTQSGAHDPTFNIHDDGSRGDGSSAGIINCVIHTVNNNIVIGGNFSSYNGGVSSKVARVLPSGEMDPSFQTGVIGGPGPRTIIELATGKLMLAGPMSIGFFISPQGVIRLNQNGSIDLGFNLNGVGYNAAPFCMAVQSDGKIVTGGSFSEFNFTKYVGILRLNPNGDLDTSFLTQLPDGSVVNSILIAPDGKIYIGGLFSEVDGFETHNLARLLPNGRVDSSFVSYMPPNSFQVLDMKFTPNNRLIINTGIIERIGNNGSLDTTFNSFFKQNSSIRNIHVHTDGSISFLWQAIPFTPPMIHTGMVRLDSNGIAELNFDTISTFTKGAIRSFSRDGIGNYILGGSFEYVNNKMNPYLAKLNTNGEMDVQFNLGTGFNGIVKDLVQLDDGKILVGGDFRYFNLKDVQNFIKLRLDGTQEPGFFHGEDLNGSVNAILSLSDGKIILAGDFTHYNGHFCGRMIRLMPNGLIDSSFTVGQGFSHAVNHLSLLPDGKILASGAFTEFNNQWVNNIVRLNANGSRDMQFVAPMHHPTMISFNIHALQSDGKILVGGTFKNIDLTDMGFVNRLNSNGSLDATFSNSQVKFNNSVQALYQESNGKILVGGFFSADSVVASNGLARLNANGSIDASFAVQWPIAVNTLDITKDDNGNIIVAGSPQGINMLRPNGTVEPSFQVGSGFTGQVYKLLIQSDKKILAAGTFVSYQGIPRNRIARILHDDICVGASGLGVSEVTHQSAIISWIEFGGAQEWYYDYGEVPHTPSAATMVGPITDTTDTLYSLNPLTHYEFWVRSTCAPGYNSDWAGPFPFRTQMDPNIDIPVFANEKQEFWYASNQLYFKYNHSTNLSITLIDMAGRTLFQLPHFEIEANQIEILPLPPLPSRMYVVRLQSDEESNFLKFNKF